MKKFIKSILFLVTEFIIIIICVLFGKYLNSEAQKSQMLTIEKIALVNLDEGTEVNHSIKNYGVEFIGTLDGSYEVTGLEQARKGLENGLYAAYIIIPAAFSKNIESINGEPVKSNILYKINYNLEASTREKVITNITSFNSDLSTNIEYVFLDALLREVHMVQDKSDDILENDLTDLKNILKFAESDLVVDPDYPEERSVDHNIQNLDLSKEYSTIQGIFAKLSSSYRQDEKKAQDALNVILSAKDGIDKEMNAIDTKLNAIGDDEEESNQYIDHAEEYQEFISSYNNDLLLWKEKNCTQIDSNFKEYLSSCDQYVNEQLSDLSDKHKEYFVDYYVNAFARADTNEVSFNYDQKEAENYLDLSGLSSYQYLKQIGSENIAYKKEYKDLGNKIRSLEEKVKEKPYSYEVEKDGEKIQKTGYLMTTEDIEQLMKCVDDLKEVSGIVELDDLEYQLTQYQKDDVSIIGRAAEKQKNAGFKKFQKESLYNDLIYYGAENRESIENYVAEAQYTEFSEDEINEIVDHFYNPELKIVVKGNIQQEDAPTEDTTENEETNNQPVTETTESETSTETEVPGAGDEEEESKRILFRGTSEVPVLDEKQLTVNIVNDILKPVQSNIMDSYTNMKNEWISLNSDLSQFKIDNYSDNGTKGELENSFNTNVSSIENAVGGKEREYTEYAGKVEEASRDNLTAWQETVKKANEATHSNMEQNLSGIRENRKKINETNSILLTDITNALPYSRLGELENKKVYSFITTPVEYQNISEDKKIVVDEQAKEEGNEYPVFIGMGILILLLGSFLIIRMTAGKRNNNIRNKNSDLL